MQKILFGVTVITLMARLLSLVSNQVFMIFFGPQDIFLNIYTYALNVPNIMFNFVGTVISAVVVPIYSGLLVKDKKKSQDFIKNAITIVCIISLTLIGVGFFISPLIARLTAFYIDYHYFLIYTLRIMMIAMFFYGLNYIFQGILQSHNNFLLPAFVAVPTSIVVIGYVFFFGDMFGVRGLVYATVFGLSLQAAVLFPGVRKLSIGYRPSLNFNNPDIKQAIKLSVPVLLSVISFQINTFFNATIATRFSVVPIMMFVQNLMLVSILSIIYSIMGVYLPKLTALWEQKKEQEYKVMLEDIILIAMFFLVPAGFGLFMLARPIINLISGWGNFNSYDVSLAAGMLSLYATGIVSIGIKEVMDRAFYSKKDSKIPGFIGIIIMIFNIGISLIILNNANEYTMPIGFAISTTIGTLVLVIIMNKTTKILNKRVIINIIKFLLSAIAMTIAIYFSLIWFGDINFFMVEVINRAIELLVPLGVGIIVYFVCIFIFKVEQVDQIVKTFLKR